MSDMDSTADARTRTSQLGGKANPSFVTSVEHPRLKEFDPESIRSFLHRYDQYTREVDARARQLLHGEVTSAEPVRPVNLKFCVDPQLLDSAIALDYIPDVSSYDELADDVLRTYLDSLSQESKDAMNLTVLDRMVETQLHMDMNVKSADARVQKLFMTYHTILRKNGLAWILKENQKVAVYHVLSAIRPLTFKQRIESDLSFSYHTLKKDFRGFREHVHKLAVAFQLVDCGPRWDRRKESDSRKESYSSTFRNRSGNTLPQQRGSAKSMNPTSRLPRSPPRCPFSACKKEDLRHWIADCPKASSEQKERLRAEIAAAKASDGPARNTRSQAARRQEDNPGRIAGSSRRVQNSTHQSCNMTISNGKTTLGTIGRCDDGSDASIASPLLAGLAARRGIGKIVDIPPTSLQVALKTGHQAQSFKFSRRWTVPRTIMHLPSGALALQNISFLVADDELACEELLIGLPVLRHLRIDSQTLLENQRATLDGTDCATVPDIVPGGGLVSRMMISRNSDHDVQPHVTRTERSSISKRPHVNFNFSRQDDDPFEDSSLLDQVDSDQDSAIQQALDSIVAKAEDNGLPQEYKPQLERMLRSNTNIFRTSLSSGPPADVEPLRVELVHDAQPVKVRLRNYSPAQRQFLDKFMKDLIRCNMVFPNPSSKWASAPLLVPKAGSANFRFTVDLRPVNKYTLHYHYPMPNIEQQLNRLDGSRVFATFDLSHGYWQFPLHPESRECQSIITPDGVFTPTRVLHGTTNAVKYLQSTLAAILPSELQSSTLFWLDDILIYAKTVPELLNSIAIFFELCAKRRIRLHPAKCSLFAKKLTWCGRVITSSGIWFDPKRIEGLTSMAAPQTAADLQQFLCAMQWLKQAIPNFIELIHPLHKLLEAIFQRLGKRTKRSASRVALSSLGWDVNHDHAFKACQEAIQNQVRLSYRDHEKRLCFFTDASDVGWSAIVTQVPYEDLRRQQQHQHHQPLAFLSGQFNSTQVRWSTIEKEAFAILSAVKRMHWLAAAPEGFDIYTDHNNLVFMFDPLAVQHDLSVSSTPKVLRWALQLSYYNYVCFHIEGKANVWADLLSRWQATESFTIRRIISIPPLSSAADESFDWPNEHNIAEAQSTYADKRPSKLLLQDNIWRNMEGAVWIPDEADDLQLRLCIIAHTSASGHRGADATERSLRKQFFWTSLTADVHNFVRSCIHCLSTTGGQKIPRPFGPAVHGTRPNELLQFDYIEIGPANNGEKYILMLRDDHSDYKWFFMFPATTAANAAMAIVDWCGAFNPPTGLMSDGPTHFRNETLRLLSKALKMKHHFTLPYVPWSNGAVERLGREVVRFLRALCSELRLSFAEWPDLVPIMQSVLNNSPSPQRGNVAPITAMTGLEPKPPIKTFLRSTTTKPVSLTDAQYERLRNIKDLCEAVDKLHPMVQASVQKNRKKHRQAASRGELPNFIEGDFVLLAREDFHAGEKLALRWRGPRRIVKSLSDYVFEVEDLRNGQIEQAHGSRLKYYSDASLNVEAILPHVLASETGMPVARLLELVEKEGQLFVRVRWKGLQTSEDTLEPIEKVFEDVPKMFVRLLDRKTTPVVLAKCARQHLSL